jgi:hypothetical protein
MPQQFDVVAPNWVWVTDIVYIRMSTDFSGSSHWPVPPSAGWLLNATVRGREGGIACIVDGGMAVLATGNSYGAFLSGQPFAAMTGRIF